MASTASPTWSTLRFVRVAPLPMSSQVPSIFTPAFVKDSRTSSTEAVVRVFMRSIWSCCLAAAFVQ